MTMAYQVPSITFFHQELEKHFRFLTDEFGLARVHDHSIELRAMFQNDELDLWIGNDRGTYDAIFWLKKSVPWLSPSESRMFLINDIVRLVAPEEFLSLQSQMHNGELTSEQECEIMFHYYARSLKRCCMPILQGSYQILEQLHARR